MKEEIELILVEASAYGLRAEVIEWAEKFMLEGHSELEAYQLAFDEWVK